MSGLTVGYNSIDPLTLKLKEENGTEKERTDARKIKEVISDRHLLLATLLLSNAVAMESLPIFLDAIMPASLAILISTTVVLVFGEVLPQAICLGPNQLAIAAGMAPFIKGLMYALYIICNPIAKGLDWVLGVHTDKIVMAKKDLKTFIRLQNGRVTRARGPRLQPPPGGTQPGGDQDHHFHHRPQRGDSDPHHGQNERGLPPQLH
jgi:metal transporter CNNM